MREFLRQFATNAACLEYLVRCRWTDGWICLSKVLRAISVAKLEALRVRVPFMWAADVAYRGHDHASLARSGAGVVLGGLRSGHA